MEKDPNGLDSHTPGAKLDDGKIKMALMTRGFSHALQEVGRITTYGAIKYSPNGWKKVPNGQARYEDALLRHLNKWQQGEELDPDSFLLHLSHLAWNALALLELTLEERNQTNAKATPDPRRS